MSFATQRAALAAQLANDGAWSTYSYPPAIPTALSVVIEPDNPYVVTVGQKTSLNVRLRFRVRLYVGLFDNQGNLQQLEDLAYGVRQRILDATQNCGDLSAPEVVQLDTGDLLTAYFPVEIITEWT